MDVMATFKLTDSVIARIAQIVQEGMLMQVDVVDLMRQIEVVPSQEDASFMDLSPEYVKRVRDHHKHLVEEAEKLMAEQAKAKTPKTFLA